MNKTIILNSRKSNIEWFLEIHRYNVNKGYNGRYCNPHTEWNFTLKTNDLNNSAYASILNDYKITSSKGRLPKYIKDQVQQIINDEIKGVIK